MTEQDINIKRLIFWIKRDLDQLEVMLNNPPKPIVDQLVEDVTRLAVILMQERNKNRG